MIQIIEPSPPGRRPNTILPETFICKTMSELRALTESELKKFADEVLGLPIKKGTDQDTIITKILNSAWSGVNQK